MKKSTIILLIIIGIVYVSKVWYESLLEKNAQITFQQLKEIAAIANVYHKQNNQYPSDWTVLDIPYENKKIESDGSSPVLWIGNNEFKILPDGSITGEYFITEVFFTYNPAKSNEEKPTYTCYASRYFNAKDICLSFNKPVDTPTFKNDKGMWYIYPIK